MRDILRMARPRPNTVEKEALFGYFVGKDVALDKLPDIVRQYENYKRTKTGPVPEVDFRMLDSLGIGDQEWMEIARRAPWQMTRMNLNTFARHNVFQNQEIVQLVAARLRNAEEIEQAQQFPYQMYTAWQATNASGDIPFEIKDALQDAMEISINNVPEIPGQIYVCMDMSGSMANPITGSRAGGRSTVTTCVQVAGLIASAIARKNRSAEIWTFHSDAQKVNLNPRDTVLTNTQRLARAGGGTDISAPLHHLNLANAKGDAVIYVSDNESWMDSPRYSGTGLLSEWITFKKRNPQARLVCIDLTPRDNAQVKEREDILQVGGWSDVVFDVVSSFMQHGHDKDHWVEEIEKIGLDSF
jgi:60 kDa SS-A/Ro ribonucleoprotein